MLSHVNILTHHIYQVMTQLKYFENVIKLGFNNMNNLIIWRGFTVTLYPLLMKSTSP